MRRAGPAGATNDSGVMGMMRFIQGEWKFFIILALLLAAAGLVYYEYRQFMAAYKPPAVTDKPGTVIVNTSGEKGQAGEPQVVYIQGANTHTKEVVYVPKETDPKTGVTEKTDVQFEKKAGKIYVKVNGKDFEVPADVQESTKFEKGKLVVTEQTEMRINLTTPKPAVNLGVGWSKNGAAATLNGPLYKNVSWWVYGDRQTMAGGIQFPIMNK